MRLTHMQYIVMQPCSVRHIARKAPIPCYGLLKHAAETRPPLTHKEILQYINIYKPHICLHDIRSHKSKIRQR